MSQRSSHRSIAHRLAAAALVRTLLAQRGALVLVLVLLITSGGAG